MKKKDAKRFMKDTTCVFGAMEARMRVNGEKADAGPFISGAMMALAFAGMLLGDKGGIERNDPRLAAEQILGAAVDYHYNGRKGE